MKINAGEWIFISGQAGYGKTWIAKQLTNLYLQKGFTVFILDYTLKDYREFEQHSNTIYFAPEKGTFREIEDFIECVYETGNCIVVLDEADNYLSKKSDVISRFVTTARNRNIGAIVIAKRPKAIKPEFRTRFNKAIIFRTKLKEDKDYLKDWWLIEKGNLRNLNYLGVGEAYILTDDDTKKVSFR